MAQISRRKKTRRDYHHGDLRNALLASARSLLERGGPVAVSLRAVARAAGVSQAAPYHHFPDKEHLWVALASLGFNDLRACQIAAAESSAPHMRLSALGNAYVRFASQNPNMYRLMFGEAITDWGKYPEAACAKRRCFEPSQAVIASDPTARKGPKPNGAETIGIPAWALVHGLAMLPIDGSLQEQLSTDPIAGILHGPVGAEEPACVIELFRFILGSAK